MKYRMLAVALLATVSGSFAVMSTPAQATTTAENPCKISGFYDNEDEQTPDQVPTFTTAGFVFSQKDLIHHVTSPIDLPDVKANTTTYVDTNPGKVVVKYETQSPYSSIIVQADGKVWSTAMTYDQIGGQGHPVDKVSDLVGTDENPRPTKPGKAPFDASTKIVTWGLGYWVEDGSTTVSSITFHGVKYDLTCKPAPATSSASPKPSSSGTTTVKPSTSTSHTAGAAGTPTSSAGTTALAVTGTNTVFVVVLGVLFVLAGGLISLFVVDRRRRNRFVA